MYVCTCSEASVRGGGLMGADITAEWNSAFPMARTPQGAVELYTVEHIATGEL
jgi:hypothetical protein